MIYYTSLEQSKKLLELGLNPESADMRYGYIAPYDYSDRMFDGGYDKIPYPKDFMKCNTAFSEDEYDDTLPCWSVGALLKVMHKTQNVYHDLVLGDRFPYIAFDDEGSLTHEICCGMTILEACYNMVVWLLENGYIKKGE